MVCLPFCRNYVCFLCICGFDSERELEFSSDVDFSLFSSQLSWEENNGNLNNGSLATWNWGSFKRSTLNFAVFCSGCETRVSEILNSDSSLKMQDQSSGSQQLLFVNFCFHLTVTGLLMFLSRNEIITVENGGGTPKWAIVSLSINHRQQGNRYLTQEDTELLSSPFPCKPQGTF